MPLLQRLALFSFIVFFSGSVVVVAARNLHSKLAPHTDKDKEQAQKLIEALRGDELFKAQAKYSEAHPAPARRNGSYLPDHDRRRIKNFLSSLIGGKDAGSDEQVPEADTAKTDPKQGDK
jgi:hypothetical protein